MKTLFALAAASGLSYVGYATLTPQPVNTVVTPQPDPPRPPLPVIGVDPAALEPQPIQLPFPGPFTLVPGRDIMVRIPAGYPLDPGDYRLAWSPVNMWGALNGQLTVVGGEGYWNLCIHISQQGSPQNSICDYTCIRADSTWVHQRYAGLPPVTVWQP